MPAEDPANGQNEQNPSQGAADFSQDEIDALLEQSAGGAETPPVDSAGSDAESTEPQPDAAASEPGAISQGDIDGLLSGAQAGGTGPEPGAGVSEPEPIAAAAGEVSQADIDALLSGAGEAAGGPSGEAAGASMLSEEAATAEAPLDTRVDTLGRPFDEAAAAMQAAIEEERAGSTTSQGAPALPGEPLLDAAPLELPELEESPEAGVDAKRVTMLNDVRLNVKIELGRTRMLVEDVLKLGDGSVVELDTLAGDPVNVYVNERLIARGEVLVLNDNFCVRISDVLSRDPHRIST